MKTQELFGLYESKKPSELKQIQLEYPIDGLEPNISKKTVDLHFNTLTKNYIKNYNKTGDEFQYAGAFLHELYWKNLTDKPQNPTKKIKDFISKNFKNMSEFKSEFEELASTIHGNGWCALLKNGSIIQISNHKVIKNIVLILDMWEHAYILDYGTDKNKYIKSFWNIINWDEVEKRL